MTTHAHKQEREWTEIELAGVEAALHRARRRATHRRFKVLSSRRHDVDLSDSLDESKLILIWVVERLNGMNVPDLSCDCDKRLQLATACQRRAIDYGQAIVVLADVGNYRSALALWRPLVEACVRGAWLRCAATDEQVDSAGGGNFPEWETMIADVLPLEHLKGEWWTRLCSETRPGSRRMGVRLSSDGLRSRDERDAVAGALRWANVIQLVSGLELALAADNEALAGTFSERIRVVSAEAFERR